MLKMYMVKKKIVYHFNYNYYLQHYNMNKGELILKN